MTSDVFYNIGREKAKIVNKFSIVNPANNLDWKKWIGIDARKRANILRI